MDIKIPDIISYVEDLEDILHYAMDKKHENFTGKRINLLK